MMEKEVSSIKVYEGRVVSLKIDTVEKPSGLNATREIVSHADCIAAVVLDEKDNVILVRQFRLPTGKTLLEIPAGSLEPGEQPDTCVKRELQEEIGYLPGKIQKIGGFYSAPGYCTEYLHLYLATDLTKSFLAAEDTDEIEVVKVPIIEIPGMIINGEICDAKSVAGLLWVLFERYRQMGTIQF